MRLETMSIEFYTLNYPGEVVLRAQGVVQAPEVPRLGPEPPGEVGDHVH